MQQQVTRAGAQRAPPAFRGQQHRPCVCTCERRAAPPHAPEGYLQVHACHKLLLVAGAWRAVRGGRAGEGGMLHGRVHLQRAVLGSVMSHEREAWRSKKSCDRVMLCGRLVIIAAVLSNCARICGRSAHRHGGCGDQGQAGRLRGSRGLEWWPLDGQRTCFCTSPYSSSTEAPLLLAPENAGHCQRLTSAEGGQHAEPQHPGWAGVQQTQALCRNTCSAITTARRAPSAPAVTDARCFCAAAAQSAAPVPSSCPSSPFSHLKATPYLQESKQYKVGRGEQSCLLPAGWQVVPRCACTHAQSRGGVKQPGHIPALAATRSGRPCSKAGHTAWQLGWGWGAHHQSQKSACTEPLDSSSMAPGMPSFRSAGAQEQGCAELGCRVASGWGCWWCYNPLQMQPATHVCSRLTAPRHPKLAASHPSRGQPATRVCSHLTTPRTTPRHPKLAAAPTRVEVAAEQEGGALAAQRARRQLSIRHRLLNEGVRLLRVKHGSNGGNNLVSGQCLAMAPPQHRSERKRGPRSPSPASGSRLAGAMMAPRSLPSHHSPAPWPTRASCGCGVPCSGRTGAC